MSYKSLQGFIKKLEKEGELIRIKEAVSPYLEITEISNRIAKTGGPALLFENVIGLPYPVLMNAIATQKRVKMAFDLKEGDTLEEIFEKFSEMNYSMSFSNGIKVASKLSKLTSSLPIKLPIKGKVQEVIETDPDLKTLPVIQSWPQESGAYINQAIAVLIDPNTGNQHIAMHQIPIFDKKIMGIQWGKNEEEIYKQYKQRGGKMPISIIVGCEPTMAYAASVASNQSINGMMLTGYLRKHPTTEVKSITNNIYVPSDAEFVIEGYIDLNEERSMTGLVGEPTGYYSLEESYKIIHVTCITHKKKPVYPGMVVGQPKTEASYLNKINEKLFLPLVKRITSGIVDMDIPLEGVFSGCVIVSIKKAFPGHAKQVMNTIWGMKQLMNTKVVVVVDEDVKPSEYEVVAAKILEQMSPKEDMIYSAGPLSKIDYASPNAQYGYRLGIDATKKLDNELGLDIWHQLEVLEEESFEVKEVLDGLIREMACIKDGIFKGYTIASIRKQKPEDINKVCQYYWDQVGLNSKCFIIVDEHVNIHDASAVSWKVFNNIDAQRDVLRIADEAEQVKVIIDATKKGEIDGHYRLWPVELEMSHNMQGAVTSKWETYGIEKASLRIQ